MTAFSQELVKNACPRYQIALVAYGLKVAVWLIAARTTFSVMMLKQDVICS